MQPERVLIDLYNVPKPKIMQRTREYVIAILVILVSHLAMAQKTTRNVGEFRGVNLGMSAQLYVTQGNNSSVVIEASDDALERIETESKRWRIGHQTGRRLEMVEKLEWKEH